MFYLLLALLKLSWNKVDPNFIAVMGAESNKTVFIDVRRPMQPFAELHGHSVTVMLLSWYYAYAFVECNFKIVLWIGIREWNRLGTSFALPYLHRWR